MGPVASVSWEREGAHCPSAPSPSSALRSGMLGLCPVLPSQLAPVRLCSQGRWGVAGWKESPPLLAACMSPWRGTLQDPHSTKHAGRFRFSRGQSVWSQEVMGRWALGTGP